MLSPEALDALEREWNEIHRELERLAADRPRPCDPLAPSPEPTEHEQLLLGRLDEIEYILGENELPRYQGPSHSKNP